LSGSGGRRVHDKDLLDALEAIAPTRFHGEVWRIVRKGRDASRGSSAAGRWSPSGEFEVLYTSLQRTGALAEIGYRMSLEPVWPSLLEHTIHAISATTQRTLKFANVAQLMPLGVDPARYQTLDYAATQAIAAAAHFLEYDGVLAPSARAPCLNLVVFLDRLSPDRRLAVTASEPVDWEAWRADRRRA
jgi:hypothetical protein